MGNVSRRDAIAMAAAAGWAAVACTTTMAEEDDKMPADKWRAWAITEGKHTRLTVEGIYREGGPGRVAIVSYASPQGINPKILILDLKLATLPGIWAAVLEPIPASYAMAPYTDGQYDSISIRYPDGSAVMIDKIIDAGAGPT